MIRVTRREATVWEVLRMDSEARRNYLGVLDKPQGVHFEFWRHEGKRMYPVYQTSEGPKCFKPGGAMGHYLTAILCPVNPSSASTLLAKLLSR